jgi:hypothetical protein
MPSAKRLFYGTNTYFSNATELMIFTYVWFFRSITSNKSSAFLFPVGGDAGA